MKKQDTQKRILVLNDSQELLELFRTILEEEGYEVVLFSYAIEEMSEVARIEPDLIILDFLIGAMQPKGWQMLQKLKLVRETENIPVIICTAAEQSVQEQQGYLTSKGVIVILKPFNIDELVEAVEKAFQVLPQNGSQYLARKEKHAGSEDNVF